MTFLSVLMIAVTMAKVEWTKVSIPNPLIDPEDCNLDQPGWICDPDFWYTREEVNAIADLLGPADRVPPMSMLLLKPDEEGDNFGNMQYDHCGLKKKWTSSLKNETFPFPEMQLSLIKGKYFRVCPAGGENEDLSLTAKILDHKIERLSRGLKKHLPALTKMIMEIRENMKVARQLYQLEVAFSSILSVVVGLVLIFFKQTRRYLRKGSSVSLPWTA